MILLRLVDATCRIPAFLNWCLCFVVPLDEGLRCTPGSEGMMLPTFTHALFSCSATWTDCCSGLSCAVLLVAGASLLVRGVSADKSYSTVLAKYEQSSCTLLTPLVVSQLV